MLPWNNVFTDEELFNWISITPDGTGNAGLDIWQ